MRLLVGDLQGLAHTLFGYGICRHCVRMLRLAVLGRGEYVVPRCGRCGLAVDSRRISPGRRDDLKQIMVARDNWRRINRCG